MPVIWDLCSGLGGWSEAFVQKGWTVIRIETNADLQHVPHTLQLDVREWREWAEHLPAPDLIVASPPCREFSNGYYSPRSMAKRAEVDYRPEMDVVLACKEIIDHFTPAWWVIENVAGAITYFKPHLGDFRQKVGPFFLWGNIPYLHMDGFKHSKMEGDVHSSNPMRANLRALIPFELSFELLQTLSNQSRLEEWL